MTSRRDQFEFSIADYSLYYYLNLQSKIRFADAITCDTTTGQWTYDITSSDLGTVVSQTEFDAIIPRNEQYFTCN